jgi:predicted transposase/invertase (TIGR01784 family)
MLETKTPEMRKTVGILKKLSADERTRMLYEERERARMDELARMRGSYSKGRQEEKVEVAQNLLSLGVDPETVAKASGLALEKIQELAELTP